MYLGGRGPLVERQILDWVYGIRSQLPVRPFGSFAQLPLDPITLTFDVDALLVGQRWDGIGTGNRVSCSCPDFILSLNMQTITTSPQHSAIAAYPSPAEETHLPNLGGTEAIIRLVKSLDETMDRAIGDIKEINARTKLLALNARIEAARAGAFGAAFGVVASEIQNLSASTSGAADLMASKTRDTITDLVELIRSSIRGTRLSDLALTNIDLIDRNLYERTCDVRWWATDASIVNALSEQTSGACDFASQRMGIILDAYTVYYDLVLANMNGTIIANGRPGRFTSIGQNVSKKEWFIRALATRSGNEFAFESAHHNGLVSNQPALVYSAAVRRDGQCDGQTTGVLGVIFNWEALAQTIVKNVPIPEQEREETRCMIVDNGGRILADSQGEHLVATLPKNILEAAGANLKGFQKLSIEGKSYCLGFAKSIGFETYATGWSSLILQPF